MERYSTRVIVMNVEFHTKNTVIHARTFEFSAPKHKVSIKYVVLVTQKTRNRSPPKKSYCIVVQY